MRSGFPFRLCCTPDVSWFQRVVREVMSLSRRGWGQGSGCAASGSGVHRPQGRRVQRTLSATPLGHRADAVLAVRLPTLEPLLRHNPRNYLAFLGLAAVLCCYKRLIRLTTQDTVSGEQRGELVCVVAEDRE